MLGRNWVRLGLPRRLTHATQAQIEHVLGPSTDQYRFWSLMRDPVDRTISMFCYLRDMETRFRRSPSRSFLTLEDFVDVWLSGVLGKARLSRWNDTLIGSHVSWRFFVRPQLEFLNGRQPLRLWSLKCINEAVNEIYPESFAGAEVGWENSSDRSGVGVSPRLEAKIQALFADDMSVWGEVSRAGAEGFLFTPNPMA